MGWFDVGRFRSGVQSVRGLHFSGRNSRRHVIATAEELHVTPARFDAYAAATRLRLGCLYSFRPQWADLAEDFLIPDGEQALAAGVPAAKVEPTY